jgi:pSer/pThr/pTyr-binding forkhead associated (FHA) protein
LADARIVIGRDGGNIITGDPQASAMHAEIEFANGQMVVRDLGSSNGTWKGNQALPQFAVSAGQEFRCGNTIFKVTHIVGGQQMQGGGTVMGDANTLAELKRQRAGLMAAEQQQQQQQQGHVPPNSGAPLGLIIMGVAAGALALVGLGVGGYFLWGRGTSDAAKETTVAQDETKEDETKEDETKEDETKEDPDDEPLVEMDLGELYKEVGAATVVIHCPGSVGSGAIIDPRGVVLTNHHVIDGGERDGLRIKASVTLGKHNDDSQAIEPSGKPYEAYVLAIDVEHDLALLQIKDPPKDLPSLKVGSKKPYPGQKVAALGHAGAGMLWAIKGGEVSSTGQLAGHAKLQLEQANGAEKEFLQKVSAQMDKRGRVIQSTAKILPGDSGGPLVSMVGEIVGVNAFGKIDRASGQWLSFHVHLDEVVPFTKQIPDHPLDFIPDPWSLAEATVTFADADLDGVHETLVLSTAELVGKSVTMLDLDQDSLTKGQKPPTWEELTKDPKKPGFDPELVVLRDMGKQHFLYDTDGDGHMDVYMFDGVGAGRVTDAYKVPKGKSASKDNSLKVEDGLDAKLFTDAKLKARFERVGPVIFPGAVERGSAGTGVPEPLGPTDKLEGRDEDGDGTNDIYMERSAFHQRIVFDLDQRGVSDPEVVGIAQGGTSWWWYDTNDDGTLDLLLEGGQGADRTARKAFKLSGSSSVEEPGHVGRLLLRPELMNRPSAVERLRTIGKRLQAADVVATDDGLGSFPPTAVSSTASVLVATKGDLTNGVALVTDSHRDIILVDLDGDSTKDAKDQAEVGKAVREGKFDAEFAMLTVSGQRWAFYDTDGKGGFDLVLVGTTSGAPIAGYEIDGKKANLVTPGSKLAQWGRFSGAEKDAFAKAAPLLWPSQSGES